MINYARIFSTAKCGIRNEKPISFFRSFPVRVNFFVVAAHAENKIPYHSRPSVCEVKP